MMRQFAWLLFGVVASVFCGCNIDVGNAPAAGASAGVPKALKEQVGRPCTVQFRRDALGAAMDLPVSPMTGNMNGADVSVSGTLESVDQEWVIVKSGTRGLFIPRSAVLMLHIELKNVTSDDHSHSDHH